MHELASEDRCAMCSERCRSSTCDGDTRALVFVPGHVETAPKIVVTRELEESNQRLRSLLGIDRDRR